MDNNEKIELPKLKDNHNKKPTNNEFIDNLTIQLPIIDEKPINEIDNLTIGIPQNEIQKELQKQETVTEEESIDNLTIQMPAINTSKIEEKNENKNEKKKSKIFSMKNLVVISIITLIFSIITVSKTFSLRNKVDNYEELLSEIEYKESDEVKMYNTKEKIESSLKNSVASKIVSCLESPADIENLPESVSSIIREINDYYNQSNNYFSFKYLDIFSGFTISYNENQNIFTASTIKAPVDIYIYEKASKGEVDLNENLLYTSRHYSSGAGYIKNGEVNIYYPIKTLVEYSIEYSDNIAHHMLFERFGRENLLNFWKEKGTTAIFTNNSIWGVTNAHDATIYMKELYDFYIANDEYGEVLMQHFINNKAKLLSHPNKVLIASKSGWSGSAIHDASLIFDDNPYIVIAMSNLGTTNSYKSYFNKVSDMTYRLHKAYWDYKMTTCYNS